MLVSVKHRQKHVSNLYDSLTIWTILHFIVKFPNVTVVTYSYFQTKHNDIIIHYYTYISPTTSSYYTVVI